jgi:hypothetical protein
MLTYVLVHGAWHTGAELEPVAAVIRAAGDLLPNLPSFISRIRSGFGPCWGALRTRSV